MRLTPDQRLVIAHNPHSSRQKRVTREVFQRLDTAGYHYTVLEVQQAPLADNVARLAPQIQPGDVILSAAGDGSAHAITNAVITSGQPNVAIGYLGYGNFNDLPHTFNTRASLTDPVRFLRDAHLVAAYPQEVSAAGEHLRYALLYTTVGWTADAAAYFDRPAVRARSAGGHTGLGNSLSQLGVEYLRTRHAIPLLDFTIDGKIYHQTDILLANSTKIARLFRTGRKYYLTHDMSLRTLDVRNPLKNLGFFATGLTRGYRGDDRSAVTIDFVRPTDCRLQCDGEVVELQNCSQLTICKSATPIDVLTTRP